MYKSGSVTIIVDDLNKAEQFYVETLGLKVQHRIEGHLVQLEAPELSIGLIHPREGQDSHSGKSGNIQIALEVQHIDSTIETLKSRGVEFQSMQNEGATSIANFNDPEGNPLYLIEFKL